jgi:hypothetical protein
MTMAVQTPSAPDAGWAMAKSYSGDLRERVIEAVETGASRREAAEHFGVSVSSAVKWPVCERSLRVKNRMREIRSSGSVRGGAGNTPAYSAGSSVESVGNIWLR